MNPVEVHKLEGGNLIATYAEIVLGYQYKPDKTKPKPWHDAQGYPRYAELPNYLEAAYMMDHIHLLTYPSQRYPFLNPFGKELFTVDLHIDGYGLCSAKISLLEESNKHQPIVSWTAMGAFSSQAFLRVMIITAVWFRENRQWDPNKKII